MHYLLTEVSTTCFICHTRNSDAIVTFSVITNDQQIIDFNRQ